MTIYTIDNSINEIRADQSIRQWVDFLYGELLYTFIPDYMMKEPLTVVQENVVFPWGQPFEPQDFLRAAELAQKIIFESGYQFIPVWNPEKKDDSINLSDNGRENVFLMTEAAELNETRPAVIICPGGGYEMLSFIHEGIEMAEAARSEGYRPFVLKYRVSPNRYPFPQCDLIMAIKYLRFHAKEYGIDPDKILVIGSSAGGHLCASVSYLYEELNAAVMSELKQEAVSDADAYAEISGKPNAVCLNYPVINFMAEQHEPSFQALCNGDEALREKLSVDRHIQGDYPKTFVWTCLDDDLVPPSNAQRMGDALKESGVDYMLKTYPEGNHGCGLGTGTSAEGWFQEMTAFINYH